MNGEKPDLLKEIFDKAEQAAPPPQRPRFEYPPEEETDSPPPADSPRPPPPDGASEEKVGAEASAKLLPWLCLVLGFALLVLGVCVLQVVEMNGRLDELRESVEAVQAVDSLRAENEQLQKDIEDLQGQLDEAEWLSGQLKEALADNSTRETVTRIQKRRAEYLFYIGQFMDNGDYPMAALAVVLSAEVDFESVYVSHGSTSAGSTEYVPVNAAQKKQYEAYKQELADRGYLQLTYGSLIDSSPHTPVFQEQWDPSKSDDMAALGILWAALDAHFIQGNDEMATQYLYRFPLASPNSGYRERVERLASGFTLEHFQQLQDELVESQWLVITDDGTMRAGPGSGVSMDVLYGLPFELPESAMPYIAMWGN